MALLTTNVKNAIAVTKKAMHDLKHAQEKLHRADHLLQKRNKEFINAQTETAQAAQNAKAALSLNLNARNVYSLAFEELLGKKKALQLAIDQKAKADIVVSNAKNALDDMLEKISLLEYEGAQDRSLLKKRWWTSEED